MQRIKIGIIGLGEAWERLHAPAYSRLRDKFEITAVCDRDIGRAESAAAELGFTGGVYSDCNKMLKDADIEAAGVMVPIPENFECGRAAINAGKHLIAEKPFASSPKTAKELIRLKNQSGVKVLVAENYRYDEENALMKKLIGEHRIGNPVYFIDNHVTEIQKDMLTDPFASAEWRKKPDFKGGAFLDSGVHHIARHRFLFGNIERVFACGRPSDVGFIPYSCINALLSFEGNVAGHYSFYAVGKETQMPAVGLRIYGTGGEIYLEDRDCGFVNVSYKDGGHEAIPYKNGEGYHNELCNFYEALVNDADIVSSPEKELGDIEAVYAILESIGRERAVRLNSGFNSEEGHEK